MENRKEQAISGEDRMDELDRAINRGSDLLAKLDDMTLDQLCEGISEHMPVLKRQYERCLSTLNELKALMGKLAAGDLVDQGQVCSTLEKYQDEVCELANTFKAIKTETEQCEARAKEVGGEASPELAALQELLDQMQQAVSDHHGKIRSQVETKLCDRIFGDKTGSGKEDEFTL